MNPCYSLWILPVALIAALATFAAVLWAWQANSDSADRGQNTQNQSERIYKNFGLFVTVSLAIVSALGYVRLEKAAADKVLASQAMFGLGVSALVVATAFSLFIVISQGSKLRRWVNIEWAKMPFWLELWMCIVMMAVGTLIWIASKAWSPDANVSCPFRQDVSGVIRDFMAPFIPIVVAVLVYLLGRAAYFRQKEYELIVKRYLEEGIDAISRNVDAALGRFRHNWWTATVVLKHFRDLGADMPKELRERTFLPPDISHFEMWRDYRLRDLVGDEIFNHAHQKLDAFVRNSYAFFQNDLSSAIRVTLDGGAELEVKVSREEMVEGYIAEIEKLDSEARRFYALLGELQNLSSLLQTERFGFRGLRTIRQRSAVKMAIERLRGHFDAAPAQVAQLDSEKIAGE